jgi:hypothetical protein
VLRTTHTVSYKYVYLSPWFEKKEIVALGNWDVTGFFFFAKQATSVDKFTGIESSN